MEEMQEQGMGKGQKVHPSSKSITLFEFQYVHQPRKSPSQVLLGFYGNFTTLAWLLKSLVISN